MPFHKDVLIFLLRNTIIIELSTDNLPGIEILLLNFGQPVPKLNHPHSDGFFIMFDQTSLVAAHDC